MRQVSYDLDLQLNAVNTKTPEVSQFILTFLHNHATWCHFLSYADLDILWLEHKKALLECLTHPSLFHQVDGWPTPHNQRLEFLGDSALDFYISKKLIDLYPQEPEGVLSRLRSTIVNVDGLALWARAIDLHYALLLGRGEIQKLAKEQLSDAMCADAFEALVGVMSTTLPDWEERLDSWVELVEKKHNFSFYSLERLEGFDPKTTLQEKTLALYKMLPTYEDDDKSGEFTVTLKLGAHVLGKAKHISKKKAKALAAQAALENKTYLGLTPSNL
jgi:ribonuclease-3